MPELQSLSQVEEKSLHYSLYVFSTRLFVFIYENLGEDWTACVYLRLVEGCSPSDGGTCGEEGPVNESEDREP